MVRTVLVGALAVVVLGGCGSESPGAGWPEEGGAVTIQGEVLAVDREPWMVDGDGTLEVETREHGRVTVLVPARINLCQARGMDVATSVEPGDRLRVTGEAMGRLRMSACRSAEHAVEKF